MIDDSEDAQLLTRRVLSAALLLTALYVAVVAPALTFVPGLASAGFAAIQLPVRWGRRWFTSMLGASLLVVVAGFVLALAAGPLP